MFLALFFTLMIHITTRKRVGRREISTPHPHIYIGAVSYAVEFDANFGVKIGWESGEIKKGDIDGREIDGGCWFGVENGKKGKQKKVFHFTFWGKGVCFHKRDGIFCENDPEESLGNEILWGIKMVRKEFGEKLWKNLRFFQDYIEWKLLRNRT